MRVLVVEEDRSLGAFLQTGLQLEGHQVEWVVDGDAALLHAVANHPDMVLLDLGLPGRDGMEVLAEIRERHNNAMVLVLTARNDLHGMVQCLDMGADDCLLKPFSFLELKARCRALQRRRARFANPTICHGDLELHRIEHTVVRSGRTINLTVKEFALLEVLMLHRCECVSRSQLLAEAWQTASDTGTNIVDVYINYLRRKLEGDGAFEGSAGLIDTVRGQGYRLGGVSCQTMPRRPMALPAVSLATYA